jgi:hypothetical protein
MSQQKREQFTTPKGVAKWITINTPDTKFKDEGEYRVSLLLKGKDADVLKAKIDEALSVAIAEAKANKENAKHKQIKASQHKPYKADTDKEGNETGFTEFTFKAKASGVSKKTGKEWTFKPRVFDAKGVPMNIDKTQVWGGSTVKVAYEVSPYGVFKYSPTMGVGISLKLAAVQILDLKTGTGKDAKAFGFGEEEGYAQGDFSDAEAESAQAGDESEEF